MKLSLILKFDRLFFTPPGPPPLLKKYWNPLYLPKETTLGFFVKSIEYRNNTWLSINFVVKGRLQTSQLQRQPPVCGELSLMVVSAPSIAVLHKPFELVLK